MQTSNIRGLVRTAQLNAFEAAARQALETFRPRIEGDGANRFAIPSHWGRSNSGLPVRTYRNPRTGALMVFGVHRQTWEQQGRIKIIPLR
jgi:hypothetical protein